MSIGRLQRALGPLPYSLREQIVGYARSVDAAAPEIARGANVQLSTDVRDRFVFAAGLRKYYALCASSFWAIDNAAAILETLDVGSVRVGRTDYSRGADMHVGLRRALADFDSLINQYDLLMITNGSLTDLMSRLASDGR